MKQVSAVTHSWSVLSAHKLPIVSASRYCTSYTLKNECFNRLVAAQLRLSSCSTRNLVKERSTKICQAAGNAPNVTKAKVQDQRWWYIHILRFYCHFVPLCLIANIMHDLMQKYFDSLPWTNLSLTSLPVMKRVESQKPHPLWGQDRTNLSQDPQRHHLRRSCYCSMKRIEKEQVHWSSD